MQNEKEIETTALLFLEYAESYLREETRDSKKIMIVSLPSDEEDFNRTFEALNKIRELGKKKNISVNIETAEDSFEEYGHTNCFRIWRAEETNK